MQKYTRDNGNTGIYERAMNLGFHQSHVTQEGVYIYFTSPVGMFSGERQARDKSHPPFWYNTCIMVILQINRLVTPTTCAAWETIITACHALWAIGGVKAVVDCGYIYIPAENALRRTREPMRSEALSSIFSQVSSAKSSKNALLCKDTHICARTCHTLKVEVTSHLPLSLNLCLCQADHAVNKDGL